MGAEEINPCVDFAFKRIFGVEENNSLLKSLINSIVSKEDQVQTVTLLNPYNIQDHDNDKLSILDIKAKGSKGEYFDIEIQVLDVSSYEKRALYYLAKLYTDQIGKGEKYKRLNKAIGIHILNFDLIRELERYHNVFRMMDEGTKTYKFKDLELHTIELNKFLSKDNKDELSEIIKEGARTFG